MIRLLLLTLLCIFVTSANAADIYLFTKNGNQIAGPSTIAGQSCVGGIDYIGNGHFLASSDTDAWQFEISGPTASFVKTIRTYGGIVTAAEGIYLFKDFTEDIDGEEFYAGDTIVVAQRTARGNPPVQQLGVRVILFDIYTGQLKRSAAGGFLATYGFFGVSGDGNYVYIDYITNQIGTTPSSRQFEFDGRTYGHVKSVNHGLTPKDRTFDGAFWWLLDDTQVQQFEDGHFQNLLQAWNHGLTTPNGIATNGNFIVICD